MRTLKSRGKALAARMISACPAFAGVSQGKFFPRKEAKFSAELSSCLRVQKHLSGNPLGPTENMKTFSGETYYSRKISAEQTKQDTAETGEAATWLQYGTVSDLLVSSRLLEVNHDQIVRRYEGIPGKGGSRGESSNRRRRIANGATR